MPSNPEKFSKAFNDIKRVLNDTASFLKNTAEEMQKLSKSLIKAEKDFIKIKFSDVEAISTPPSLEGIEEVKKIDKRVGPPKRKELEKPHPPIAPKKIKPESIDEKKILRPPDKRDMSSVRNRIEDLLDRLKEEVDVGTNLASEKIGEKENLDTLKSEMTQLYNRFKSIVKEDDFYDLTPEQRSKALKDMAEAIEFLTDEYNK